MRHVILAVVAVAFASTAVALAGNPSWVWTEPKAERIVARDATVRLQGPDRALEAQLRASARLYGGLALAALDMNDPIAAGVFRNLAERFGKALDAVQGGVKINGAACKGSGTAQQGRRFKRFRCAATSPAGGDPIGRARRPGETEELPTVIEGPPRILGPWRAQLDVRVTGRLGDDVSAGRDSGSHAPLLVSSALLAAAPGTTRGAAAAVAAFAIYAC